jgi:hypothetical protein
MEVRISFTPSRFIPWEGPFHLTYWRGVWVDPRADLDAVAKRIKSHHCPCRELNPSHPSRSLITVLNELRYKGTQRNTVTLCTVNRQITLQLRQFATAGAINIGYSENRSNEVIQCMQKEAGNVKSSKKRFNRHSYLNNRTSTKFLSRSDTLHVEII